MPHNALYWKAYYQKNKARRSQQSREARQRKKKEVIDMYGGHCSCCGETELEFLTIDHIDGSGSEHRKRIHPENPGGGNKMYNHLSKSPLDPNIRVHCWNCNCSRGKAGVCPHQMALTAIISPTYTLPRG